MSTVVILGRYAGHRSTNTFQAISFVTYSSPFDIAKDVVHLRVLNTLRLDDASLVGEFKVNHIQIIKEKYFAFNKFDFFS